MLGIHINLAAKPLPEAFVRAVGVVVEGNVDSLVRCCYRERLAFRQRSERFIHGHYSHTHHVVGRSHGTRVAAVIEVGQQHCEMTVRRVPEQLAVCIQRRQKGPQAFWRLKRRGRVVVENLQFLGFKELHLGVGRCSEAPGSDYG